MAARLILNADDFGLTPGINRAIAELHRAGVLTSATLMANGPAFADAVAIAHANPTLGIGCHIVLIDGIPISPPESIPTLLGPDHKSFRHSLLDFTQALLRGKVSEDEIEIEALAQIQKLQRAGIDVTHLDTHKHTHIFPAVARPLLWLVKQSSIAAIRRPFEQPWSVSLSQPPILRRLQLTILGRLRPSFERLAADTLCPDAAIGIAATGTLNAMTLQRLLTHLPTDGLYELVCHPGYNDSALDALPTRLRNSRDLEREALLNIIPKIKSLPNAPELIHYGSLGAFGALREIGLFYPGTGHENILEDRHP